MRASKRKVLAAFAVLGGLLVGMLTPAAAYATGGSDDPPPYTVDASGISLPSGATFPDGGHVNIKTSQGDRSIHFESLNWPDDNPKKYYIGKSFIPWSAFGLKGEFCVSWVQISMYNEHYGEGGQPPVCNTPPPTHVDNNPMYSYYVTCGKVSLTFTNAVVLHEGQTTDAAKFTYTDASGTVVEVTVEANQTVVREVTFSEDSGDQFVSVGVKGEQQESISVETDCQPNPPSDAIFTAPTFVDECGIDNDAVVLGESEDGVFSQTTLAGDNATLVHEVVFTPNQNRTVPEPDADDTYVVRDGTAVWTFTTTNEPCPLVVVENDPQYTYEVVCGKVIIEFTNQVSLEEDQTADAAKFTYTDASGNPVNVVVPVNETRTVTVQFPEDSGDKAVWVGLKGAENPEMIPVQTDCQPNPVKLTPPTPTFVDKCGTADDGYTIPGDPTKATSSVSPEGVINATYVTDEATYTVVDAVIDGARTVTISAEVTVPNGFVPEPGKDDTYQLVDGLAVWTFVFTDEACPTPATPDAPKHPTTALAVTGGSDLTPLAVGGGLALMLGVGVMTMAAIRRRTLTQQ